MQTNPPSPARLSFCRRQFRRLGLDSRCAAERHAFNQHRRSIPIRLKNFLLSALALGTCLALMSTTAWGNGGITITCPPDKQLECGGNTSTNNTGVATATTDCPGGAVTITYTDAATAANCTGLPGVDRTWKATDACDGMITCVQHITFVDTTPPVIVCPAVQAVKCGSPWSFGSPVATDNCLGSVRVYDNTTNDLATRFDPGTNEVGNEIILAGQARYLQEFSFEFWSTNLTGSPLLEGTNVTVRLRFYANDGTNFNGYPTPGTLLYDNGEFGLGMATTLRSRLVYNEFDLGLFAIHPLVSALPDSFTWTVQFSGLGVNDRLGVDLYSPPAIGQSYGDYWQLTNGGWQLLTNVSVDINIAAEAQAGTNVVTITVLNTVTNRTCGDAFVARRTWRATDACGNFSDCSQSVFVQDQTPPDLTVNCSALRPCHTNAADAIADVLAHSTAQDACCSHVNVTAAVTGGTASDPVISVTALDCCGNGTNKTCTAHVDGTPPVITGCPIAPIALPCNAHPTCLDAKALLTVNDNSDPNPTVDCQAGTVVTNGCQRRQTFTVTATDQCTNSSSCDVTYLWTEDTSPPVFTNCPAGTNLGCNPASIPGCDPAVGATDGCSVPTVSCALVDATNGCVRTRTITYTAVDACNNSNTCTQVITWTVDTTPPVFTNCPASTNLGCNPASIPGCDPAVGATDNCGAPTVSCAQVQVTNGCVRTRTITYTAVDACNNSNTCTQVITWTVDTTPPVFTKCPASTNLGCNPVSIPACDTSTNNVMATDDCGTATITCATVNATNGCVRTRTITYTAKDACNNSNSCVQVITWMVDTTPPVFTKCPPTRHLVCNPTTIPDCDLSATNVAATDNCGTPVITCAKSDSVSANGCDHTRTLTYTATDGCSNNSTCVQFILWTQDTTPPFFTLAPASTNLGCNPASIPDCDLGTNNVQAADDCAAPTVTCARVDATNGCVRTRTFTYTAVDACQNSSTVMQVITWTADTTGPVFTKCPTNMSLGCNPASVPDCDTSTNNVMATDDCGLLPITCARVDAVNACVHTRTLTYAAVDACNNSNTCVQVITWTEDTTPPVFVNCPSGTTNAGCNPVLGNLPHCEISVTATDNCSSAHVTCSQTQVTNGCVRTRTILYTATDACGNRTTCTNVVTWTEDTTAPTFTKCPASVNLGCNPASLPDCNLNATNVAATDGCSTPTITCGKVDATNGCVRTRTLTYTATDACGNSRNCTQVITWTEDTTPPVFTLCPASTNLGCNPANIPDCNTSTNNVRATDGCGTPTITCSKVETTNNITCVHTRTITYTAKDACNNSSMCVQVITWTEDTTPPVFTRCPTNMNLGCNPASIPTCNTLSTNVEAEDACSTPVITCAQVDVTNGCARTRTITYTVRDACNNSNTCTQIVTWTVDTTPPTINCPSNTTAQCDQTAPNFTGMATATDFCGTNVLITFSDATESGNCPGNFTITRTWRATDGCNNFATCDQIITVVDTTPPVFTNCPASTNLGCNPANIPGCDPAVGATDNCSVPTVSCALVDAANGCVRTRTLTYTAVDACNNSNTCVQVITWTEDTTPPVFVNCPSGTTNAGCNPVLGDLPHCEISVTATDNCGTAHVTCSQTQVTNGCVRTRTILYTATDACGNRTTCTNVVNWTEDTTAPTFTKCPASVNLGCNPASLPDCNLNATNVAATDGCSTPTITCGKVDATNGCVRTRTLTYTATDACGNSRNCTQVITWTEDTTPPVFTLCPASTNLGCNPASIPVCDTSTNNVRATDGCSTPTITCAMVNATNGCVGTRTITYTAKDACNNSNTCVQVITWTVDTTTPVFTNCPPPTLNLGCNPTNIPGCDPGVGATDGCSTPTIACSKVDATNGCARTRTLTYTAVDGCNNSNTCTQVITWIVATTPPVFTNCPASGDLGCNPVSIPGCDPGVGATADCGAATVSCAVVNATNGCVRTRTITYTAVDACNNSNTCTRVLTWKVEAPPALTLELQRTNMSLIISWPVTCCNPYFLEETTSLTPPIAWVRMPPPVAVIDGRNTAIVAIDVGNKFYRLKYP